MVSWPGAPARPPAARRSAQLAESRKPREVSRSYEPSAEHLHAGNDWVQSCFRATDDYESELKLKENVKKTPNGSKIQSVRFIGEKMSHKGVGVIAKTTVPAITELVREYVKVEVSGEYESLKAAKASLTEKALEVEARNAFLRKEEEENTDEDRGRSKGQGAGSK